MTFFQLWFMVTLFSYSYSHLKVTPLDAVRTPLSPVVFPCGTNDGATTVAWLHRSTASSSYSIIFIGRDKITADRRYSIDYSAGKGRYDLTVVKVQASDAGRFVCKDDQGFSEEEASAELIVVDNLEPNCTYSGSSVLPNGLLLEYETLHIRCKFCFYGNIHANATWINTKGRVLDSKLSNETLHFTTEIRVCVDSGITLLGDIENSDCGYNFTADLFKSNRSHVAIFSFHWASGNILIASPVRNISISKKDSSLGGVTLTCHAHGSPNVSYVWLDLSNWTVVTNGSELSVSSGSQSHAYQCTASNVIENQTYSLKKVQIFGGNCEKKNTCKVNDSHSFIYLFMPCLVLALVVIIIILVWKLRNRTSAPENVQQNSHPLIDPIPNDIN